MAEKGMPCTIPPTAEATIGAVSAELASLMKQYEETSMTLLQVIQEEKRKYKRIAARKENKANKVEMPSNTASKKIVNNQQTAKPRKQTIQAKVHANEDDEPARVVKVNRVYHHYHRLLLR